MTQEKPTAILVPRLAPNAYAPQAAALIRCLKPQITPGVRRAEQLIAYLQSRYTAREVEKSEVPTPFLENSVFNALQGDKRVPKEKLCFRCFAVEHNKKSAALYSSERGDDKIFALIESQTNYVFSNSNRLLLELTVARGISQEDYDAESYALIAYLSFWQEYQSLLLGSAP